MKIFLSYSHDSEEHRQRVLELANRLRGDGYDAWIDRYVSDPPEGWLRWMQRQVEEAKSVLLVCTEPYCRRFDGREEEGVGRGVTFEGWLISQYLYATGMVNRKFIPLLPDGDLETCVPSLFRHQYTTYRFPSNYAGITRRLEERPEVTPPPLGERRTETEKTGKRADFLEVLPVLSEGAEGTRTPDKIRLRVLVVDDLPRWRERFQETLQELGEGTAVDLATDFHSGRQLVDSRSYDLAVINRVLLGEPAQPPQADNQGMDLVKEIRQSDRNRDCGILVVSYYLHEEVFAQAYTRYGVHKVLNKDGLRNQDLLATAQRAILSARLKKAVLSHPLVDLALEESGLLRSKLTGPRIQANSAVAPFDSRDLEDRLEALARRNAKADPEGEIREVGSLLYQRLAGAGRVLEVASLAAEEARQETPVEAAIRLGGTLSALRIPFEFLRDEAGAWSLRRIMTRKLDFADQVSHKPETFSRLVERLLEEDRLRILLVAAEGREHEVEELARSIDRDLDQLGLPHLITPLVGARASTFLVEQALRTHHVWHYEGAGPGVTLRDGTGKKTLSPADLGRLVEKNPLHLAFLNVSPDSGGEGFERVCEALAGADVPVLLTHRWPITAAASGLLAVTFYRELWRTFSPGEALLAARRALGAQAGGGADGADGADGSWASPVLVLQTP